MQDYDEINKQRKKVEKLFDSVYCVGKNLSECEGYDELLKESQKLDRLINEYYNASDD